MSPIEFFWLQVAVIVLGLINSIIFIVSIFVDVWRGKK